MQSNQTTGRRLPRLALCAFVLAAAGGLSGCASFGNDQAASGLMAGPGAPTSFGSQTPACYGGGGSGLVDDCGAFARYNGP